MISHGDSRVMCFVDLLQWRHDSNLTMNVLLQFFTKLSQNGCLPECLLLQMDKCYYENKNKYLTVFAAYMVEKEISKEFTQNARRTTAEVEIIYQKGRGDKDKIRSRLTDKETIELQEEKWILQHLKKYSTKKVKHRPADPTTERQEKRVRKALG